MDYGSNKGQAQVNREFIAHVRKHDDGTWAAPQLLSEHLSGTAKLAEAYTAKFNSGQWGKAAGYGC